MRQNSEGSIQGELRAIRIFSKNNYREFVIVSSALLFFTLARHHYIDPRWLNSISFYLALPLLTIIILLRENPLHYGLRIGNWRIWRIHVAATLIIALPILYVSADSASLHKYYSMHDFDPLIYSLESFAYLFAWEFIFRGYLLFGLKRKLGEYAILVQTIPFTLLHFGKPELEILSCIITGVYFGFIAYRGNSFLPVFIIHLCINVAFRVFVNLC